MSDLDPSDLRAALDLARAFAEGSEPIDLELAQRLRDLVGREVDRLDAGITARVREIDRRLGSVWRELGTITDPELREEAEQLQRGIEVLLVTLSREHPDRLKPEPEG